MKREQNFAGCSSLTELVEASSDSIEIKFANNLVGEVRGQIGED
jgi:hypothetical protein